MANVRLLSLALAVVSVTATSAQAVVPGSPTLSMSFGIEGDAGKVTGTVTAPKNDNQWTALPDDASIDVRVVAAVKIREVCVSIAGVIWVFAPYL